MLRDNLVGLIEPKAGSAGAQVPALCSVSDTGHRTIDPHALKIPAPKGRNLHYRTTSLLHFTQNQDTTAVFAFVWSLES